jgi:hypothetical protein
MWTAVIAIIVFVVFMISVAWTDARGAPWVPTTMNTVRKMLTMAEVGPDDTVYDLGCGDGRTISLPPENMVPKRWGLKSIPSATCGARF